MNAKSASIATSVALVLSCAACLPAHRVADPSSTPALTPSPTPADQHPLLRVVASRRGTRSNLFAGGLVLDASRGLLFAREQHDRADGQVTFRTVVLDAGTLRILRRIGPGFATAVDPAHGLVFLNDPDVPRVSVVREESDQRVVTLPRDEGVDGVAVDVSAARLFIARDQAIDVYRLPQLDRVSRFRVAASANALVVDESAHILYVATEGSVEERDSRTGRSLRTIAVDDRPGSFSVGRGWFAMSQGDWQASTAHVYSTTGSLIWETHFSRHVGQLLSDGSRDLMFDSLDDLTDSEFAAPNDQPDVIEARALDTGKLLGSVRVSDGPGVWGVDPALRRLYITTLLGDTVTILAY